MQRLRGLVTVSAFLLAVAAVVLAVLPDGNRRDLKQEVYVELAKGTLDVGDMLYGSAQRFEIPIRNTSASPATIASISSGCSCTVLELSSPTIPSGGVTLVRGELRADRAYGDFQDIVTVTVLSPYHDVLPIRIRGRILSRVRTLPELLVLRPGSEEYGSTSGTIELTNMDSKLVVLESPQTDVEGVRFELEHFELPPGARTLLHVQVGNTFLSPHEFSLDIRCACERQNVARPVVRVDPYNGVTVNPQQIEFGVLTHRMLHRRMPLCVTLSGDALKHYEPAVRSLPPYLKVAGIENDGAGCSVFFELDEEWSGFDLGGSAVLDFLQRDCRTVRGSLQVWFHGFVRD